ncbi:MAG: Rdx family protein [Anaerolineales bacterium]|nr:Rdx family protein [Anaerolineales bacterium]
MSAVQDLLTNYQHIIDNLVIITGSKGAFEVLVNDEVLYSKKQSGRHAEPGEVLQLFEQLVGADVPKYPQSK